MAAAPARGRVWNALAACCPEANRVSSGYSGPAGRCVREWRGSASGGAFAACMIGLGALDVGMVVESIAGTLGKLWSRACADRWCIGCGEGGWSKCGIRVRYVIRVHDRSQWVP